MSSDTKLLEEAYAQVQEGIFDRIKARASGAVGAVKAGAGALKQQAGQKLANVGQKMSGQEVTTPATPAPSMKQAAGDAYASGKEASLTGTFKEKLDKAINQFTTQFTKIVGQDPASGLATVLGDDALNLYNAVAQLSKEYDPNTAKATQTNAQGETRDVDVTGVGAQGTGTVQTQSTGATGSASKMTTKPANVNVAYGTQKESHYLVKKMGSNFAQVLAESLKKS